MLTKAGRRRSSRSYSITTANDCAPVADCEAKVKELNERFKHWASEY